MKTFFRRQVTYNMGKKPNLESLLKINWREAINQFRPLLASGSPFHKLYIYEQLEGHGGKTCPTSRATSNNQQQSRTNFSNDKHTIFEFNTNIKHLS